MAVLSCRLTERDTEIGVSGNHSDSLIYLITTDEATDPLDVYAGAVTATPDPLPQLYSVLPLGYVTSVKISHQKRHNWRRYIARVSIGKVGGGDTGGTPDTMTAPLNRAPVMWIERESESVAITKDRNGVAITNSAGQPFDEPIFRDRPITTFVVRRYYDSLVAIDKLNAYYDETVNSDPVLARSIGEARYVGTETGEPVVEGSSVYWVGLTKVRTRKGGWKLNLIDRGWKEKRDGKVFNIEDENGLPIVEPVFLDGAGKKIVEGGTPGTITKEIYTPKAYAPLFNVDRTDLDAITGG